MDVEVSVRCGCEPPGGGLAADLLFGDLDVLEGLLVSQQCLHGCLVPGSGCFVELPGARFGVCGWYCYARAQPPVAARQPPRVPLVQQSL